MHILVPLDGSDLAFRAVPVALRLAHNAPAEVSLVYARPSLYSLPSHPEAATMARAGSRAAQHAAFVQLQMACQLLQDAGITVHVCTQRGAAAEVIVQVARKRKVDLIVMSSHGEGGVKRWLFGSVAADVLRRASVPVVVCPPAMPSDTWATGCIERNTTAAGAQ